MMDYRAVESTQVDCAEACERKVSSSELIRDIRKELAETLTCLTDIKMSLDGDGFNDRKAEEPKCMNDELSLIERMAMDCIGLSHAIHALLFGSGGR